MTQKILIIGSGDDSKSALLLATLSEKYGEDIILLTPAEAVEQGLKMEDFTNTPTIKIEASPLLKQYNYSDFKTGKEKRRERRKEKRQHGHG
jgi:hypothetical protein